MLSIKETKSGGVAIIFGKEYASVGKALYPALASEVLQIEALPQPTKNKTLSDVRSNVEGVGDRSNHVGTITRPRLTLNTTKTTAGVPESEDEIRAHIRELISELSSKDGLRFGSAWNKAYRILYDKTGFDVYKVKEPVIEKGKVNLVKTVINCGKGADMLRSLRSFLDS